MIQNTIAHTRPSADIHIFIRSVIVCLFLLRYIYCSLFYTHSVTYLNVRCMTFILYIFCLLLLIFIWTREKHNEMYSFILFGWRQRVQERLSVYLLLLFDFSIFISKSGQKEALHFCVHFIPFRFVRSLARYIPSFVCRLSAHNMYVHSEVCVDAFISFQLIRISIMWESEKDKDESSFCCKISFFLSFSIWFWNFVRI